MATWTTAERDALKAAVASGVLQVRYDGPPARSVTYQSLAEMRALLAEMESSLARSAGTRTGYTYASRRKGL